MSPLVSLLLLLICYPITEESPSLTLLSEPAPANASRHGGEAAPEVSSQDTQPLYTMQTAQSEGEFVVSLIAPKTWR